MKNRKVAMMLVASMMAVSALALGGCGGNANPNAPGASSGGQTVVMSNDASGGNGSQGNGNTSGANDAQGNANAAAGNDAQGNANAAAGNGAQGNADAAAGNGAQGNSDAAAGSGAQGNTNVAGGNAASGNTGNTQGAADQNQALSICLAHAGVAESDLQRQNVRQDSDDGVSVWEVEFLDSNGVSYEYELNAADGTIHSFSCDAEALYRGQNGNGAASVTEDQVKQTVLERVPGAAAADVRVQLESDDGRTEYEAYVFYDNMEYEFRISAADGGIIEWEGERSGW